MAKGKKSGEAKAVTSGKRAKKVLRDNVRVGVGLPEVPPRPTKDLAHGFLCVCTFRLPRTTPADDLPPATAGASYSSARHMKLHLALESGMTPTARSEHTHTAYQTKSARSNRLLAPSVSATRPLSDLSPLSRALILSLLARGCVEKNPGPPKPRSHSKKKVSVDDAVVDAPKPAAPKRNRHRPSEDDAVADAPRSEAPKQDRGRDPTVRTPPVPTAPASSSTVPAPSAQPAPLRPPAPSTRPNQPRLSGGKRSRSRSISMGRVLGGALLHPLRKGMANPSQHACALSAVVNALVASLHYVKDCCLPPYLLQLHSDPDAAAAAAVRLLVYNSTIDEAWSNLVSAEPMREFEHDYLRVHICSSRPPLNTFTHSAHAVPIPNNRRHDPAVVLASTIAQSIETTGRIYSVLPTGDAYLVHTDPDIGFTHFPEQHLPLVNRLWRISAIIVRHPERFHFVTLTRRGNAVFLLDDDKPPLRLGTPSSEQPYGLAFYLQRPVAILAVAYPDGPSYVQPTIPQRASTTATTTTALPSFGEISMASPADLAAAAAADTPLPAPSPKTRPRPTTPPRPTPAAAQDDDDAQAVLSQLGKSASQVAPPKSRTRTEVRGAGPSPAGATAIQDRVEGPPPTSRSLKVLQWNACGLTYDKLVQAVSSNHRPHVLLIQECKRCASITGYSVFRSLRDNHGGGAAIFVRDGLPVRPLLFPRAVEFAEVVGVEVSGVRFVSGYFSLRCVLSATSLAQAIPDSTTPSVMGLDVNAHHPSYCPHMQDLRGDELLEWVSTSNLVIANVECAPTRSDLRRDTAPDVTLCSTGAAVLDWKSRPSHLSDHYFITFNVALDGSRDLPAASSAPTFFWSLDKADWSSYRAAVDSYLSKNLGTTTDASAMASVLTAAIAAAARIAIPRGRHSTFDPAACLRKDRVYLDLFHEAEAALASNQPPELILELRAQYRARACQVLRDHWQERASALDASTSASWKMLKKIGVVNPPSISSTVLLPGAGPTGPGPPPIQADTPSAKAELLTRQFFGDQRAATRPPLLSHSASPYISDAEIDFAISSLRPGKAPGADEVTIEMIRELPPSGSILLRRLVRQSIRTGVVPSTWKLGLVMPLPKPGKDTQRPQNWRPVTLTSILSKIVERVVCERLLELVPLNETQFGFRRTRTTSDAIHLQIDHILECLNVYEPSEVYRASWTPLKVFATAYDLTQAFDRVNHKTLLRKLRSKSVPAYLLHWIRNFVANRTARVLVRPATGRRAAVKQGVPQGTILGPILFALYIDDLLDILPKHSLMRDGLTIAYADDVSTLVSDSDRQRARDKDAVLHRVVQDWCTANDMELSPKTTSMFFSRASRDTITAEDGTVNAPKFLGIRCDCLLYFGQHVEWVVTEVKRRTGQLRAVAGMQWGPSTATLRRFYKGYVEPLLTYGISVWYPHLSVYQRYTLDCVHRAALRVVTGLPVTSQAPHVYREAACQPLSVIAAETAAKKFELDMRLPHDDVRHIRACQAMQESAQVLGTAQRVTFDATLTQLARLASQHLPRNRLPATTSRPYTLDATDAARMVHIHYLTDVVAPPDAPDAFKRAVSEQSIEARRLRFGPRPLFTISTDASVRSTGSAGTARFFDKDLHLLDDDPLVDRRTGSLACSYTAESVTILRALQRLQRILPDKATRHDWILLITDSQSFLSELATGPVRHKTASHYGETWKTLLELGARGYRLVLQFVHSHVGVELNEIADEYVTYLNDTLPDHDSTLVHRVDSMRYFRNTLPTRLSGLVPPDDLEPRAVSVEIARICAGESLLAGVFVRRVARAQCMACRWCAPELHPLTVVPEASQRLSGQVTLLAPQPIRKQCLLCKKTTRHCHEMRAHYLKSHALHEIPPEFITQRRSVSTTHPDVISRSVSRLSLGTRGDSETVATRRLREAPPPEVQAYLDAAAQRLAPPPPGYATETITHVLFECPALSTLRQNIPGLPPPPSLAPTQETLITILHPRYLAIRKSVYRFFAAAQGVLRPDLQSQASQLSTVP
jgi:ribonuclease HI